MTNWTSEVFKEIKIHHPVDNFLFLKEVTDLEVRISEKKLNAILTILKGSLTHWWHKFTIVWTTFQWSMKNIDIIWLAVLTIVLTHLHILFYLIRSYFKDKPLGTQSLLDVITIDNAFVSQFTGTVSTLTSIITRFETVKQFSALSPLFVSAICTLYTFAFVSICVHGTCLCFIRTLCLTNLSFIEEMIGENLIRILMNGITLLIAISACTAQILSGEINSGTAYILLTEKIFKTGF